MRAKKFTGAALVVLALVVGIEAGGAWAGQEPWDDVRARERELKTSYKAGDYAKALKLAGELHAAMEDKRAEILHRIASLHCLLGEREKAYEWLQKCLDAGYDAYLLPDDKDFQNIRDEERFRTMVRQARVRQYIAMLERGEREAFQKSNEVMAALAFKPGERVADIGAGSGYFTVRVARAVGPAGTVWAIDIRQEMLDYISKRLEAESLKNVRLALVTADDPKLPTGGVDTILMVDTIHYISNRAEYAKKLRAGLAPGGRLVIIDYIPKPMSERPWGPTPEQQVSRETLDAELAQAGFKPVKVRTFLPEQYLVEYGVAKGE